MLSIGIDVAKTKLDCCINDKFCTIPNDVKSIKKTFASVSRESKVLMEATGKYHRLAHSTLEAMGFKVMIVNPFQSKHFAKAMNLKCKTDAVDAKMLSLYADRMNFKPTPCAEPESQELQELSRHLDDLKEERLRCKARIRESSGFVKASQTKLLKSYECEIKATENRLKQLVDSDEELTRKYDLLMSIPGIGQTSAIYLMSYLRELGSLNKREIASLAGLAPMNRDSGTSKGRRRIEGGRSALRKRLYMPIVAATTLNNNPRLREFYLKLIDANKPQRVAFVACMRKLVIWANSIIAKGEPWQSNFQ